MNIAIILLGGKGVRFGSSIPKQFYPIKNSQGESVFEFSASRLVSTISIGHVLFVIPKETNAPESKLFFESMNRLKKKYPDIKFHLTRGGENRHQSFMNGVAFFKKQAQPNFEVLIVHDANRPFLSNDFLLRVSEEIRQIDYKRACSIPVIPSVDSLVLNGDNLSYLPREEVYQVQTPQLLWWASVLEAFSKNKGRKSWPDEGSFMSEMGFRVFCYPGEAANKKITYQEDIANIA